MIREGERKVPRLDAWHVATNAGRFRVDRADGFSLRSGMTAKALLFVEDFFGLGITMRAVTSEA